MNNQNNQSRVIPLDQLLWLRGQSSSVNNLLIDCWIADGFGNINNKGDKQFKVLDTCLKEDSFRKAKKIIDSAGLFEFERSVRSGQVIWRVWNPYGVFAVNRSKYQAENIIEHPKNEPDIFPVEPDIFPVEPDIFPVEPDIFPVEIAETLTPQEVEFSQESANKFLRNTNKYLNNQDLSLGLKESSLNITSPSKDQDIQHKDAYAYMSKENETKKETVKQVDEQKTIREKIAEINARRHELCNTPHRFSVRYNDD